MRLIILLFLPLLTFSCTKKIEEGVLPRKDTYKNIRAIYMEERCCSNMEVIDGIFIKDPIGDRNHNFLAVVNVADFPSSVQFGDTLTIDFSYSDKDYICDIICNMRDGIKVEVKAWE